MAFPVDEKYVVLEEQKLGITCFPESYRQAIMINNGGIVSTITPSGEELHWWLHPIFDSSDRKRIARSCNSVSHETFNYRKNYNLEEDLILIGRENDCLLLLLVHPNHQVDDAVYATFVEDDGIYKIADDFKELTRSE